MYVLLVLSDLKRTNCMAIKFVFLLFLESDAGRSKTLRKLRSKTIALFSKDGGYSTLPR